MLYAGIARLGTVLPLTEQLPQVSRDASRSPSVTSPHNAEANRLMEPVAAWYVSHVLIGTPPPENGVPGRVAFKTGTSYGYRDAWSVGFDGRYTIGIWVGRPDGAPVPGLVGRMAAAPILFDAFARLPTPAAALPRAPSGVLVTTSAKLPPPLRHFPAGRPRRRGAGEAAYPVSAGWRAARFAAPRTTSRRPVPLKLTGARRPGHYSGQWRAGFGAAARHAVLSASRARDLPA